MSIRKIAELTGLSVATVSHVINGTRSVSVKNRDLVLKTINAIGYKPNMAAKALRTQRSNAVAMLIPTVEPGMSTNSFFIEAISGAKDALERQGYNLLVSTYLDSVPHTNEEEMQVKQLRVLQNQWIDGVILVPNKASYKTMLENIGKTLPFVLLDRDIPELKCSCVHSDNVLAAYEATSLLVGCGHTRIAYIGGPNNSFTGYDRYQGYTKAITDHSLEPDKMLIQMIRPYTTAAGYDCAKQVISAGADAIFVTNHVLAIGVLKCLHDMRVDIPGQVSIATFEDYEWMDALSPALTSVRQNPYQMGSLAADILIKKLQSPGYSQRITLKTELVLRASHGVKRT